MTHTKIDLLQGKIFPSMVRFAIPIFFSSVFQQMYNTMDTVIVGHTLGENALAAMGAATPVYDLLIGFALGVGNGLSIVTARSYGAGNREELKKSVASSVVIGGILSLVILVLTRFLLVPFLRLLNTPEEILWESHKYVSVITFFTVVTFAYNLCAGLLRAIGNSLMPLLFLILSSVLNVGLDYFFIAGIGMGVEGAAIATVIAQGVSVVLCLIYIGKRAGLLVPSRVHFAYDKTLYGEMLSQGFAMGFMNCLVYAGSAILQSGINGLGALVIAGHTAARKVYQFGMMVFIAMIQAVSTFVSQNFGAGQIGRIRKAMKYAYLYNGAGTLLLMAAFFLFAPNLIRFISGSGEAVIIENGSRYLYVVAPAYFVLGTINATRTALQAIGSKILPILSSIIELIGKILFVAVFVPRFGYNAVIFCEPVIWCFMAVELVTAFWCNPHIRNGKKGSFVREM